MTAFGHGAIAFVAWVITIAIFFLIVLHWEKKAKKKDEADKRKSDKEIIDYLLDDFS